MQHDTPSTACHPVWYETLHGHYALEHMPRLLHKALSTWPRRRHSLLEINCGAGYFLDFFWAAGFDVTGIERHLPLLEQARTQCNPRVDLHVGVPDALPYEDNAFDYAAIVSPLLREGPSPQEILREAVRVTSYGILLCFFNPYSLTGLSRHFPWAHIHPWNKQWHWLSYSKYAAILEDLAPQCRISCRSMLLGPPYTWQPCFTHWQKWSIPLPLGSIIALRMEHKAHRPLTSIPLRIRDIVVHTPQHAAVFERRDQPLSSLSREHNP